MKAYRITGSKYAGDLSGTGAARYGGRWNKKGRPVLYTGASIEIALLESLVHVPHMIIPSWDLLTLEVPEHSMTILTLSDLPANGGHYPAPVILAEIGERWHWWYPDLPGTALWSMRRMRWMSSPAFPELLKSNFQ